MGDKFDYKNFDYKNFDYKNFDYTKGMDYWKNHAAASKSKHKSKTGLKITIPAGVEVKLMNIATIHASAGATIELTLPFPMSEDGLGGFVESIKKCGVDVEMVKK